MASNILSFFYEGGGRREGAKGDFIIVIIGNFSSVRVVSPKVEG